MVLYYKDESGSGTGAQGPAGAQGAVGPQGPQGASSGSTCGEGFLFAQTQLGAVTYIPQFNWTVPFATTPAPVELDTPNQFTWLNNAFTASAGLWLIDVTVSAQSVITAPSTFVLKIMNGLNNVVWQQTTSWHGVSGYTYRGSLHIQGIAIGGNNAYSGLRATVDINGAGANNQAQLLDATFRAVRVCPVTTSLTSLGGVGGGLTTN